ncbi:MAG: carbohydrate kinase [Mesorhizobium sp.]
MAEDGRATILCCGEALIDMLPRQAVSGETAYAPFAGGAVFNTAVALGRLGADVEFFSGISTDMFGAMLERELTHSNVGMRHIHRSAHPTTLAFVTLADGQARYSFHDEGSAGRILDIADLPQDLANIDALLFGAISLIPEPCGSTYETLMRREHAQKVVMLDPNIRPDFIPDTASHRARILRMAAMSDIVKVSNEDLDWIGEGAGETEMIARLLDGGAKIVLVTRGSDGADAYTASGRVHVPARTIQIVDTVGAGDTLNAGVLASLSEQGLLSKAAVATLSPGAIEAMLEFGIAAASVTVSRAGANPPWRSEIS